MPSSTAWCSAVCARSAPGFLIFSDYARPALRLGGADGNSRQLHVFTHDSIGVGEDGPTHQPVEQLASLRAMPGMLVIRPADANEVAEAWRVIMEIKHEPVALALTRQALPTLDRMKYGAAAGLAKGAYILADADGGKPQVILIGTGSEVSLCIDAYEQLKKDGIQARVVSMPSWELFERQSQGISRAGVAFGGNSARRSRARCDFWLGAIRRHDRRGDRHEELRRLGAVSTIAEEVRFHGGKCRRGGQGAAGELTMRIVIGADHAGFDLKQIIAAYLRHHGHEVIDQGTDSDEPVDYPDFAEAVSEVPARRRGRARRADLRQRRWRLGRGEQVARHSRRLVP